MSCHSVAVVLTLVNTKQIRINILVHKRNNTKRAQTIQNTVNTSTHITKTPTHYKTHTYTHPHNAQSIHTHTHTLQNPYIHTPTHYKKHTCTHPHVTKQVTSTVQDIHQIKFYVPELIKMV